MAGGGDHLVVPLPFGDPLGRGHIAEMLVLARGPRCDDERIECRIGRAEALEDYGGHRSDDLAFGVELPYREEGGSAPGNAESGTIADSLLARLTADLEELAGAPHVPAVANCRSPDQWGQRRAM